MSLIEEYFLVQSNGLKIRGIMHLPDQFPAPCVICSHGLFSAKESPKFIALATHLAGRGFVAIRYDHHGCGESEGRIEDTTVSGRLADLDAVVAYVRKDSRVNGVIGLMGSSLGGYISLFTAARRPEVAASVVWATPIRLKAEKRDIRENGYPALKNDFYEDLKRYHMPDILGGVRQVLVLHGEKDELVPMWHASALHDALAAPKKLKIFFGGDHRFTDESVRIHAIEMTSNWFKTHLLQ